MRVSPEITAACSAAITSGLYMWYSPPCMYLSRPPCSTGARVSQARFASCFGIRLEVGEVRALHAALGAGEAQLHHLIGKPDDLEQLRAAIAGRWYEMPIFDMILNKPLRMPRAVSCVRAPGAQAKSSLSAPLRIISNNTW
jgi:hypothetical protein